MRNLVKLSVARFLSAVKPKPLLGSNIATNTINPLSQKYNLAPLEITTRTFTSGSAVEDPLRDTNYDGSDLKIEDDLLVGSSTKNPSNFIIRNQNIDVANASMIVIPSCNLYIRTYPFKASY